jgi:hypothetical protein
MVRDTRFAQPPVAHMRRDLGRNEIRAGARERKALRDTAQKMRQGAEEGKQLSSLFKWSFLAFFGIMLSIVVYLALFDPRFQGLPVLTRIKSHDRFLTSSAQGPAAAAAQQPPPPQAQPQGPAPSSPPPSSSNPTAAPAREL